MTSRNAGWIRAGAPWVLLACAAISYPSSWRALSTPEWFGEPTGLREVATALTAARSAVPRDSSVLVITASVPAMDFDYWFGLTKPVRILVPFPANSPVPQGSGISVEDIRKELARRGALFTEPALDEALDSVAFVAFDSNAFVDEVLTLRPKRLTPHGSWGPVKIYRVVPK